MVSRKYRPESAADTLPPPGDAQPERRLQLRWRWAIGSAFLGSFLLFLRTTAPTVSNLDSAELTTAAATGGLVHATGYPLYLLIGRIWSLLPIGDMGYRMNLLSAFCGALTIALLIQILRRLGAGPWPTLCAAGLLASTRYFWAMALVAEVYTMHTALMCGVILCLLRWADRPTPLRLGLTTALLALAAGNHASIVLLAPGCLFFVLATSARRALKARSLIAAAIGLCTGLCIYLYLPFLYLQHPKFNYLAVFNSNGDLLPVDLTSIDGFLWLLSAQAFSSMFFSQGGASLVYEVRYLILELWRSSFALAFGPAIAGLVISFRRSAAVGGALLLMFLCNAAFFLSYGAPDRETMYLPIYLVWAIWIGIGCDWSINWVHTNGSWAAEWILALLLAATVPAAVLWNFPLVDLSDDWSAREYGEVILSGLETDALLFGSWDSAAIAQYLQLVEGKRPDLKIINRFHISKGDMLSLIEKEIERRPLYSDESISIPQAGISSLPEGAVFRLVHSKTRNPGGDQP